PEGSGVGIPEGTLLLRETVFESWPAGTYSAATIAARLLFRCRQDPANVTLLTNLFPATIDMISQARKEQIPASTVDSALEMIKFWELESPPPSKLDPASRDSLIRFYFVVECNSFPTGLLVTLSYANHSCNPNSAVWEESPDSLDSRNLPIYTLTAKRDIPLGEEITISYIDLVAMVELSEDRQRRTEEHFLFLCTCEWCCTPLEKVGLLQNVTGAVVGPKFEDFVCNAFPGSSEQNTCTGSVGRSSGVCETCKREATQKQLDNVQNKADRLILSLRRTLLETNEFLKKMDDARKELESASRPSTSGTHSTTTTEGDERIKDAASLKELMRLKKLMEGLKTRATELLHESHIAFGPIQACLEKLDGLIGFNSNANAKGKKKGRSKQASNTIKEDGFLDGITGGASRLAVE
ncbi:UNVERIFIED_CONTAM: hypothetical protein HDU68_011685, partial [Siphonaria sp. JEL0065]